MMYCDDFCKHGKKEFLESPHTAKRVLEEMEKLYEDKRTPYMGEDDRPCACGMIYCNHMCKKGKRDFLESPHAAKRAWEIIEKTYMDKRTTGGVGGEDNKKCSCGMMYCDDFCKHGKKEFLESPHTAKRVLEEMEKLYVE